MHLGAPSSEARARLYTCEHIAVIGVCIIIDTPKGSVKARTAERSGVGCDHERSLFVAKLPLCSRLIGTDSEGQRKKEWRNER